MAKQIRNEIKEEISSRTKEGHKPPHLTAVLVGNDPASETYVRNKIKACNDVGMFAKYQLSCEFSMSLTCPASIWYCLVHAQFIWQFCSKS